MASDAVPVSMVMTCDDAVEMMFMDGSRVQLSPCGSCFMYDPPINHGISQSYHTPGPGPDPGPSHPLYTSTRTQQRTCFVTSRWRSKVMAALEFRNRFASRPFLCTNLSQEDKQLELYADITRVEWSNSSGKCTFSEHPDHSLELTSGDSLATLILSPSGQDFSVKYLCKLQPESAMAVNSSRGTSYLEMEQLKSCEAKQECSDMKFSQRTSMGNPVMTQDCQDQRDGEHVSQNGQYFKGHTDPMMSQRVSSEEKVSMRRSRCKFWYTWVVQNHSVAHCPWYWRHPLDLLLKHKADIMKTADVAESSGAHSENDLDDSKQDIPEQLETHSSPLPPSLPLCCDESHLHKHHWRTIKQDALDKTGETDTLTMYGRKVSVLVVGRVVYRLFWDPLPSIEIYPGNGEVIMSHDERGSFFRLVKVRSDGSLKELMISVSNPPPDTPHSSYSIAELVRRGSRLLQCIIVYQRTIGGGDNLCCWKKMALDDTSGNAGTLMERSIIPGLGQLEAYSNGVIRGYFNDEVTIETNCIHPSRSYGGPMDLQVDDAEDIIFTVMLAYGCRKIVTSRNPGAYLRHVNALLEWRRWAGQSSEERLALIETKRSSAEISKSAVQTELLRIRNLTYMIDANNLGGIPGVEGGKDLATKENKGCTDSDVTIMSRCTGMNGSSRTFHSDRILSENLTEDDIAKALSDTALAVCDIEGMLGYQ